MSASPSSIQQSALRRSTSPRQIAANRRNASRSTGPRTPAGKARVAGNAIKHGFFAGTARWTLEQHQAFEHLHEALREEFRPCGAREENRVEVMASTHVKMAMVFRYEAQAALRCHQNRERETNAKIARADRAEAARLVRQREALRRAGLWVPTIPEGRIANTIIRYSGSLDRAFHRAYSELQEAQSLRSRAGFRSIAKTQKQTHLVVDAHDRFEGREESKSSPPVEFETQKQTQRRGPDAPHENAKTKPITPAFPMNRHDRRRAKALDAREAKRARSGREDPVFA